MKSYLGTLAVVLASASFAHAQITDDIKANITHTFMIGNQTLPPGSYTFHMVQASNLSLMRVTGKDGKTDEFTVRATTMTHSPRHSELIFRKYGDTEILVKVFERGQTDGAEVAEIPKQEASLAKQGRAVEHSEEQP
jgi:hypothetical protein